MSNENYIRKNSDLVNISEAKLSEISENYGIEDNEDHDELKLIDIEDVKRDPKIYQSKEEYVFSKKERIDVYIKNYLNKFEMTKTLKTFEQEFYEFLSKDKVNINDIGTVPEVYIESELIQEEIGNIQKELDDAKIYAEKAKSLYVKLDSQRQAEKIKHRRVQQEKKKLIKEIDKIKKIYAEDNKIYKDLKNKYWNVTNESLLLENEQTKFRASYNALKEQFEKSKKMIEEGKKQKESKNKYFIIFIY